MPFPTAMRREPFLLLLGMVLFNVLCPLESATAEGLVSGKYQSVSGTDIVLSLNIQNPAPASLIVEQYFPPANTIIDTSPKADKIDRSQGNGKWLFRNTRSGVLSLSIRFEAPLQGDISATVRYRNPQSGTFTELKITP